MTTATEQTPVKAAAPEIVEPPAPLSPEELARVLPQKQPPRRSPATEAIIRQVGLGDILDAVLAEERLTETQGVRLYETPHLPLLGYLANIVRERKNGRLTYFNRNIHVNYTNICNKGCKFCAFQRLPGQEGAYSWSPEECGDKVREYNHLPITEVHMVAGINPQIKYQQYIDMLREVKRARPSLHIKAFTMVELAQIVRLARKPEQEVLRDLIDAGLGSCPGGGAEIFADRVHEEIFGKKLNSQAWLDMQREVHRAGLHSNATMLYGHIENAEERVDHLNRLRLLQDETGGFNCFIPLAFHPENTELAYIPSTSGETDLRNIAVARLMLDNFPHIKAYWVMLTPAIAQIAQGYGADDIDGTIHEEKIYHEAGAQTSQVMTVEQLCYLIEESGRIPVERDTVYNIIRVMQN
jgi:aminodeoxyfutalosine synthase